MDKKSKSQPQLLQRRWSYVDDIKRPPTAGSYTSLSSAPPPMKSSTLPQIASRPKTAFIPRQLPSGYQSSTNLEQKRASYSRERPTSALVRPLSGRIFSGKVADLGWTSDRDNRASVVDLEDLSGGEDDCDVADDDGATSLHDLLTCSALNVEAKARKPNWNVSDRIRPVFHCPRCRDHWYGLTPFPCDEVRARGVWHNSQEDKGKAEGRSRSRYRSKSAHVRYTDKEQEQASQQSNNSNEGHSRTGDVSLKRRESPPKMGNPSGKANKQVTFKEIKDSTELGSRVTKLDVDGPSNGGNGDGGGGVVTHENGGLDITAVIGSPPDNHSKAISVLPSEHTRQQDHSNMSPRRYDNTSPRRYDGAPVSGEREAFVRGLDTRAIIEHSGSHEVVPTECLMVSEGRSHMPQLKMSISEATSSMEVPNSDLRQLGPPRKDDAIKYTTPPVDHITAASPTHPGNAPVTSPTPSEQHSSQNVHPPVSPQAATIPRNRQNPETTTMMESKRVQGGPLVHPIPPRRHTIDVSDLINGFKLTRPWTFTYHTSSSSPKKALRQQGHT